MESWSYLYFTSETAVVAGEYVMHVVILILILTSGCTMYNPKDELPDSRYSTPSKEHELGRYEVIRSPRLATYNYEINMVVVIAVPG